MRVREAYDVDVAPACAVLDAAFHRRDESRLFCALRKGSGLAVALVAAVPAPRNAALEGGYGAAAEVSDPSAAPRDRSGTDRSSQEVLAGVAVLSHLLAPDNCVGLGPLAVAPEHGDRGVGKALIGACIDWARHAGQGGIFVLGRPRYYTRFGFSLEAARPFRSQYPAEFLLALELKPGALEGGGQLRYPAAFAGL